MFCNSNSYGGDPGTLPWIVTGGAEAAEWR